MFQNQILPLLRPQQQTQQQKSGLPDEIAVGAALTGEEFDFETFKDLPEKIKNSKGWEALTDEQKVLAYFTYKTQTITNDAAKIDAEKALDEAMKLADPVYKVLNFLHNQSWINTKKTLKI